MTASPAADTGKAVVLSGLRKSYGAVRALNGASLEVDHGAVVVIIGPSGCGKSTLLRCINLLERPDEGRMVVGGREIVFAGSGSRAPKGRALARYRSNVGMVFQQFHLFPHLSVIQNVMEGPVTVKKLPRAQARQIAQELLAKVGLSDKLDAMPAELSGGQAQRVAIARALSMSPGVMLFDEVTSALDPELVGEVLTVLQQLANDGMTMILVTHEMSFALDVADYVYFVDEGVVVEHGPPRRLLMEPQHPRLQAFLSRFRTRFGAGS